MTERVAIFIDGSNLYHAMEENCGRMDLDFSAFIGKLSADFSLFRAYYYNILQDAERRGHAYSEQQKFLSTLYNTPLLEVRLGTSKYRGDVLVEKGVDIMVSTDILQLAWRDLYDRAILVSGDGDFSYALQAVKDLGKRTEVVAFPGNLSHELSQTTDFLKVLDRRFFDELWVSGKARTVTSREDDAQNPSRRRRRRRIIQPARPNEVTMEQTESSKSSAAEEPHLPEFMAP